MSATTRNVHHRSGNKSSSQAVFIGMLLFAVGFTACGRAAAQNFPSRPFLLTVPYVSSQLDTLGRLLAAYTNDKLGQPMVVESKPGANGRLPLLDFKTRRGDPYRLAFAGDGNLVSEVIRDPEFNMQPGRDYTSIVGMYFGPYVAATTSTQPFKDLRGMVAWAKANPGKLNSSYPAAGGGAQISATMLGQAAGFDMVHVPYKGSGQMIPALLGGQVHVGWTSGGGFKALIDAGRIIPLVITSAQRLPQMPNVPTAKELGFPALELGFYIGIIAPADLPREAVSRMNAVFNDAMKEPAMVKEITDSTCFVLGGTPEAFTALIQSTFTKFAPIMKDMKLD